MAEVDPADASRPPRPPVLRTLPKVLGRTLAKAWDDSIFSSSAQAAFWQTLGVAPLVFSLLGCVGYIAGLFGPDTVASVTTNITSFMHRFFSDAIIEQLIEPIIADTVARGRADVISISFILSLWAGSSAVSSFLDSICEAHGQAEVRHPIRQRFFALGLYIVGLTVAVFLLPLLAVGPSLVTNMLPESARDAAKHAISVSYVPAVGLILVGALTTLYRVALPNTLPWLRLIPGALLAGPLFWSTSFGLRVYLEKISSTGYTYGALATPIALLLTTFFLGLSIIVGAQFNAVIQQTWPVAPRTTDRMRQVRDRVSDAKDLLSGPIRRRDSGPIRDRNRRDAVSPDEIRPSQPLHTTDLVADPGGDAPTTRMETPAAQPARIGPHRQRESPPITGLSAQNDPPTLAIPIQSPPPGTRGAEDGRLRRPPGDPRPPRPGGRR